MYCYHGKNSTAGTVPMLLLLLLLLFSLTATLQFQGKTTALALPGPGCLRYCGDVEIQYPFGVGHGCAMEGFELRCNRSAVDGHSFLTIFGIIPSTKKIDCDIWGKDLSGTPFRYSGKSNMFTVIGINALAYMADNTHVIGCVSQSKPYGDLEAQDGKCDGDSAGCCQAALADDMNFDDIGFSPDHNTTDYYEHRNATDRRADYRGYAVVMETDKFQFKTTYLNTTAFLDENAGGRVPAILIWEVGNETCDVATKKEDSYACLSANSVCVNSSSGGYLCNCSQGFEGNPYLPDGCKDIDECVAKPPPCARCKNKPGGYDCPTPLNITALLSVGSSIGVAVVASAVVCTYLTHERKKLTKIKRKYFQQHGGMLLLHEISLKQGTAFTVFTEAELIEATGNFADKNILGRGGFGTVYRGLLKDGGVVAVKRCVSSMASEQQQKEFGKEMLILSQINHKNIVKLLGCCLEVEVPMLVYEFIPNGTLFQFIHGDGGSRSAPFSVRIRIALESALALSYLHSWASPPILHGDVKSSNILLDQNYEAKVSDFGASILAPADKSQFMTLVQGTCGYLDPEYMQTCQLTDKSDVYSFGVVLLELLTGSTAFNLEGPESERSLSLRFLNAMKERRLGDIIDGRIKADSDAALLEEVAELALQCLDMVGERRPTMRDVAERLDVLAKAMQQQHPWVPAQHRPEEMESLLGESPVASAEMTSTGNFSMEERIVHGLLDSGR
ncbi:wall-associated receptor kinase 3 isoform X1 [Zea mays]|uniref:Protein kinase domain-containing protein n=1 Tax=Zea mays TaxID=4577 RepID=A0A804R149_MAIZE|nr:uncharacterized protein LOC100280308 isoform X1 [Zea mays]|eukprot:XP_020399226.1 uncharacterized protein LOC100280308 isoform X1 [Zea mays]